MIVFFKVIQKERIQFLIEISLLLKASDKSIRRYTIFPFFSTQELQQEFWIISENGSSVLFHLNSLSGREELFRKAACLALYFWENEIIFSPSSVVCQSMQQERKQFPDKNYFIFWSWVLILLCFLCEDRGMMMIIIVFFLIHLALNRYLNG